MTWTDRLGELGVWRRSSDIDEATAQEVERLGYGTIWLGGSPAADLTEAYVEFNKGDINDPSSLGG